MIPLEAAPWSSEAWRERAEDETSAALDSAGRPRTGASTVVKLWGRSWLRTIPTADGPVWVKHAYRLPPGEEKVLAPLAQRWPGRVPRVVATWEGAVAMEPLEGEELTPEHSKREWVAAARGISEIEAGEAKHVDEWIALGVRDRRPPKWRGAVELLLESPVLERLERDVRVSLDALIPDFIARYEDGFVHPPTLVHQDSGCCNIHVTATGPVLFDWSDVVVGHPAFSCDRLLDQTPAEARDAVIEVFCETAGLSPTEFASMRRSNVLHEVLRYHDELAYLAPDDPVHGNLSKSVRSQLGVLVAHEASRR